MLQDEYLWTKGTWRDFKLRFPLHQFSDPHATTDADVQPSVINAAVSNSSIAADEGHSSASAENAAQRWLPADLSSPQLQAALQGYEGISLSGAMPATSGSGALHAGAKLSAGRVWWLFVFSVIAARIADDGRP
jgi:hypothetical protein